ncbi:MAG: hypothetical protein OHK0046_25470 [Anaerolineae bacterium]
MSLFELVLDQPLILISMAVVVVPLLLAFGLWLIGVIQRARAARPARPVVSETTQVSVVDIPEDIPAPPVQAAPPTPAAKPKTEAKPEVQQLLNAVFVDEAAEARYAALMDGLDEVTIIDLQSMIVQVAGKMGVQHVG